MRKILLFLLLFPSLCFAQINMGDIEVNLFITATLNFDRNVKIDYVILGNNPKDSKGNFLYYEQFQKDNTCTFKALNQNAPTTSVVVRLQDGRIYKGIIRIGDNGKIIYNFEDEQKAVAIAVAQPEKDLTASKEQAQPKDSIYINQRLTNVLSRKDKYFIFGTKENGLTFSVAHIVNDDKYTYLKLKVKNNTGNDYIIDGIHIKYQLGKRKGLKSNEVGNEERPPIIHKQGVDVVKAYSEETIGLVCPVFAVGEKGLLKIQIMEMKGNRTATIEIAGNQIIDVDVY